MVPHHGHHKPIDPEAEGTMAAEPDRSRDKARGVADPAISMGHISVTVQPVEVPTKATQATARIQTGQQG